MRASFIVVPFEKWAKSFHFICNLHPALIFSPGPRIRTLSTSYILSLPVPRRRTDLRGIRSTYVDIPIYGVLRQPQLIEKKGSFMGDQSGATQVQMKNTNDYLYALLKHRPPKHEHQLWEIGQCGLDPD